MKTREKDSGYKSSFIGKYIGKIIEKRFPKKTKRLMYVSSLIAMIRGIKEPNEKISTQLNEIFKIAEYPDAILFPIYIKSFIWKELSKDEINILHDCYKNDKEETIMEYIDRLIYLAPDWIRYGSLDLIKTDTMMVLRNASKMKLN